MEIRDRTACFVKKRTGETHGRQRELIKSPGLCGSAFFGKFYVLNNVVLLIKGLWKIMKEKNEEKKDTHGRQKESTGPTAMLFGEHLRTPTASVNPETNTAMAELSEMVELRDAMDPCM